MIMIDRISNLPNENEFVWENAIDMVYTNNYPVVWWIIASVLYYPLLLLGQRFMKNRKAFDLGWPLFVWNVFLCVYSGVSAYYVLPQLYVTLGELGVLRTVCHHEIYKKRAAVFVFVFNISKFFEWLDTVFLVMRKRKVVFLHWFHHLVTYLYCLHAQFFSYSTDASGFFFCGINLLVHTLMYGYWALTSIETFGWLKQYGFMLTVLQTSQMVVGILVLVVSTGCERIAQNWHGLVFATIMYSIYLYYFFQLARSKTSGATRQKRE